NTLSRFYSIHMLVLPLAIAGLILLHLWLVIRLGVSNPPWGPQVEEGDEEVETAARQGLVQPVPRGNGK
ncbi:MAG TPA: cytochrome b N-terminal domain-containing protein, partial [Gaiellaceae bacterium]|nr:cytochrome b N-terminal domain-containing protein [Gaiellaceae bacterium]